MSKGIVEIVKPTDDEEETKPRLLRLIKPLKQLNVMSSETLDLDESREPQGDQNHVC